MLILGAEVNSRCAARAPAGRVRRTWNGASPVITAIFELLFAIIGLITWALILSAVVQTLISFGVLDTRNRLVWTIADFLYRVTEPIVRPIRNVLPSFGNVDLSPLVAILGLRYIVTPLLTTIYVGLVSGRWSLL